jgi:predicted metal-dependent hydrolase
MSTPVDGCVDEIGIPGAPLWKLVDPLGRGLAGIAKAARYRQRVPVGDSVEVRRSTRRRRTVSAYRDGSRIVVLIPARFSRQQEQQWVDKMVASVVNRESRAQMRGPRASDEALMRRCLDLAGRYLDGRPRPVSVRWVGAMRSRWASCTPGEASIRVSARLRELPSWVLDYVLVHELTHLLIPGHDSDFWALVARYPLAERARGYLDGVSAAAEWSDDLGDDVVGASYEPS